MKKKKKVSPTILKVKIKSKMAALVNNGEAQKELIAYILSVVVDEKAKEQRRDRMARILLPYICIRTKPKKEFASKEPKEPKDPKMPRGKKAKKAAMAKDAGKGTEWDGLLS